MEGDHKLETDFRAEIDSARFKGAIAARKYIKSKIFFDFDENLMAKLSEFEGMGAEVDLFREDYGVPGFTWGMDFMKDDRIPEEIKQYCRERVEALIPKLSAVNLWYMVKHLSKFVGDFEEMKKYIGENGITVPDYISGKIAKHYDLFEVALEYGKGRQINKAMSEFYPWLEGDRINGSAPDFYYGERSLLHAVTSEIRENLSEYIGRNNIELKNGISSFHVNAAMEISRMDYDHIIGIYRGCTGLTTPLEVLGDNVRYIDYSRDFPEEPPKWIQVGRVTDLPKRAYKVLVCEDDAVTGDTLTSVIPLIQELEPKRVVVRFHGANFEKSRAVVDQIPFYDVAQNLYVGFERYVGNLREFNSCLKKVLKKCSAKKRRD